MNNLDFLSNTVALDLGKSGVKIAETLEIEVNNEWWRLINASDVTEAKVYQKRSLPAPIISGDTLYLGMLDRSIIPVNGAWEFNNEKQKIRTVEFNDVKYFYAITSCYNLVTKKASFKVWTEAEEIGTGDFSDSVLHDNYYGGVFFDGVNGRFIAVYDPYYFYYTIGTGMSGLSYIGYSTGRSSDFWSVEVFNEDITTIYSFFFSSAGGIKVKKTTPTTGVAASTLYKTVVSNADSVSLTAVTGYNYSKGIYPFYLRAADSAGVAWVNNTTGQFCYALESESWGTIHFLPNVSGFSSQTILGFGTSYIPNAGEYFLFTGKEHETGEIVTEPGYSFPENFSIMTSFIDRLDHLRVFGLVGTTIHAFDLTLSTMSFAYLGVAYSAWSWNNYNGVKVGESGDLDLLVFGNEVFAYHAPSHEVLVLYNRVTNLIIWTWSNFSSSTVFPSTYNESENNGGVFRFDDSLLFLRGKRAEISFIESIVVPISSVMACSTTAEVSTLLHTVGAESGAIVNEASYGRFGAPGSATHCLTGLMHDDSFFYFLRSYGSDAVSPSQMVYKMGKTSRNIISRIGYIPDGSTGHAGATFRSGIQKKEGTFLYDNRIRSNIAYDDCFRLSKRGYVSNAYAWSSAFLDPVHRPTAYTKPQSLSAAYILATTILVPAIEEKGQMASYKSYGTTMVAFGGSWDMENATGAGFDSWTASFSPIKSVTDEWNDVTVYFGNIANGVLPYMKHSSLQGRLKSMYAIKVSDSSVYKIDLGHICGGGMGKFSAYGDTVVYSAITGAVYMVDTGALLTDGIGGAIGGGGASAAYLYEYLDRQFIPYPFAREGIRAELSNISKTTKITLPETQDYLIRGMLAAGTDFRGSRCILRRIFPDHAAEEGSGIVLLDGYIQDWSYVPDKSGIAFTVSKTLIDVGGQFPKRLMNMGCSHVFKGDRCQYLGEEGRCLKTKAFCTSLKNLNQFGGFPWVAARQRRVMWK